MSAHQYPFIDVAVHERVRLPFARGEAVVLFSIDMRQLLWSNGREDAALSLETLWHQLIAGRKCSLLCGYSSSVCPGEGFSAICDRHSHVEPTHTTV